MKNKKEGIAEIKELIDFIYIVYTFKTVKLKWWNIILGNLKKIRKAIDEGIEAFNDRKLLWKEMKDIDTVEAEELNEYVTMKFGVSENIEKFIDHLIKGTDHFIEAHKISKEFKK